MAIHDGRGNLSPRPPLLKERGRISRHVRRRDTEGSHGDTKGNNRKTGNHKGCPYEYNMDAVERGLFAA